MPDVIKVPLALPSSLVDSEFSSILNLINLLNSIYGENWRNPGGGGPGGPVVNQAAAQQAWKSVEPQARQLVAEVARITASFVSEYRNQLTEAGAI
jgi:hypothetical protein